MSTGLSAMNKALIRIPKRADQQQSDQLRSTFVDSGVAAALQASDHQILYGRRGTGKTHALRYLEVEISSGSDLAVYCDLRTVGSPDGLFLAGPVPPTQRAARLLVDLMTQIHDALLTAAVDDPELISDASFVNRLDAFGRSISTVVIDGEVELSEEVEANRGSERGTAVAAEVSARPRIGFELSDKSSDSQRVLGRRTSRGSERISLNFTEIARALRDLVETLSARRLWLLLDEWSSLPADVQPYLGEFLVRCVLPLPAITVKIGAIEQQSTFRAEVNGSVIGIEVGADVAANVDLDEFMVYEQNEERSRAFFRDLLFRHLTSRVDDESHDDEDNELRDSLQTARDVVRVGFTGAPAFDELVRAAEGVPRDAINIAAKAGLLAGGDRISVPDVRKAARSWYQTDKEEALNSNPQAKLLLNWVIDHVIRGKRARGFLVNQRSSGALLLRHLFDARVLHLVRRGYSAQDEPGERYDVWVIDYGAYVDLVHTTTAPQGLLALGDGDDGDDAGWVEVPTQDLRAIRRAVLDIDEFVDAQSTE